MYIYIYIDGIFKRTEGVYKFSKKKCLESGRPFLIERN